MATNWELVAADFRNAGDEEGYQAAKLIARNKEYAAAGDPAVQRRIQELKRGGIGVAQAEANEMRRAGFTSQEIESVFSPQNIGTTENPNYVVQEPATTVKTYDLPAKKITPSTAYQQNPEQARTGLNIGASGAKGMLEFQRQGEVSTTGAAWTIESPNTPQGWASAVDEGAVAARILNNTTFFRSEIAQTQGTYEYNQAQILRAKYIYSVQKDFISNPTKYRSEVGYTEIGGSDGTTYSLSGDYFNTNLPSDKAFSEAARSQFNKLPQSAQDRLKFNEVIVSGLKVATEYKQGTKELIFGSISNTYKFDSQGNRIKPEVIKPTGIDTNILSTPSVKGTVTPYGLFKGSTIWAAGVQTIGGVSGNVVKLGVKEGTKETLYNLSPIQFTNKRFYPNVKDELLKSPPSPIEYKLSGGRIVQVSSGVTPPVFNRPNSRIKVSNIQYTRTTNTGLTGVSRSSTSVPYVEYVRGNLVYGRTTTTTLNTFTTNPSIYKGGVQADITSYNLKTGQTSYLKKEFFRQDQPINTRLKEFRYLGGQDTTITQRTGLTTVKVSRGVELESKGRGLSIDLSKDLTSGTGGTADKGYSVFKGTGTKTSLASTFKEIPTVQTYTAPSVSTTETSSVNAMFSSVTKQFKGTTTSTAVKEISVTRQSLSPVLVNPLGTSTAQDSATTGAYGYPTTSATRPDTGFRITPIVATLPALTPAQNTPTGQKLINIGDPINTIPSPTIPPIVTQIDTPNIFTLPPLFSFEDDNLSSKIIKGGTKETRYTPSFTALIFNITGKTRKGVETGINFRPIPKGFKFIKRRKF